MTTPGIPNDFSLSTSCFGARLPTIEDQVFAAVAMGFRQIELGVSEEPPKLNGYEDARRETGLRVTSIVAGCLKKQSARPNCHDLASTSDDEREQALNSVRRHIQLAQRIGAPVVVVRGSALTDPKLRQESLDLGHDLARNGVSDALREKLRAFALKVQKKGHRQIDHFCRSLHQLRQEFPETRLAIEPGPGFDDLLSHEAVGWVLEDLERHDVGYWHDVGHVHLRERCGLPAQGLWLESYASRMVGIHLQDAAEEEAEMPPGIGEVDWKLVASYVPSTAARVVEVSPRHGRTEVLASIQFLVDQGF